MNTLALLLFAFGALGVYSAWTGEGIQGLLLYREQDNRAARTTDTALGGSFAEPIPTRTGGLGGTSSELNPLQLAARQHHERMAF